MIVTLVRHGQASSPGGGLGDSGRILTAHGRAQVRHTASALVDQGVAPTDLWCSPLVRAVQTAELLAIGVGYAGVVTATADLVPEASVGAMLDRLALLDDGADLVLAGHEPFMSGLATALLGQPMRGFGTGDAWRFSIATPEPGGGTLLWNGPA